VIVITLGVVLVLVGVVSWAVEDVYGSGTNFLVAVDPDGSATVYDDGDSGRVVVFEGTEEQAREYMEERRGRGKSFVLPGAVVGAGVALIAWGIFGRRRKGKT
jgi:hypothetical protein